MGRTAIAVVRFRNGRGGVSETVPLMIGMEKGKGIDVEMLSQPPFFGTDASGRQVMQRLQDARSAELVLASQANLITFCRQRIAIATIYPERGASTAIAEQILVEYEQCIETAIAEDFPTGDAPTAVQPTDRHRRRALLMMVERRHITESYTSQGSHVDVVHGGAR